MVKLTISRLHSESKLDYHACVLASALRGARLARTARPARPRNRRVFEHRRREAAWRPRPCTARPVWFAPDRPEVELGGRLTAKRYTSGSANGQQRM